MPRQPQRVTFSKVDHGYQDILLDGAVVGYMGPSREVWVSFKVPGADRPVSVARFKHKGTGFTSRGDAARKWVKAVLNHRAPEQVVADLKAKDAPPPAIYAEQFGYRRSTLLDGSRERASA
jgi:hypothetical protein